MVRGALIYKKDVCRLCLLTLLILYMLLLNDYIYYYTMIICYYTMVICYYTILIKGSISVYYLKVDLKRKENI